MKSQVLITSNFLPNISDYFDISAENSFSASNFYLLRFIKMQIFLLGLKIARIPTLINEIVSNQIFTKL